jgi:hypothetical protein
MKKSRRLATLALGLSLGLAGFGPAALAQREPEPPDEPDVEVTEASDCSTSQTNDSDNSTGTSEQSGLININNVALQGLNLDLLGNLLCQGVFLNDIVVDVLGLVVDVGDDDADGDGDGSCTVTQENGSTNSTGNSTQSGLININNVALQGLNLDLLGNVLCQADFLNDLNVAVLGDILNLDGDDDDDAAAASPVMMIPDNDPAGILQGACSTEMDNDSDNDTGTSVVLGGLLNLNNLALQGNNVAVLSNGLCGSIFLNDILVSILGIL